MPLVFYYICSGKYSSTEENKQKDWKTYGFEFDSDCPLKALLS